MVKVTGAPPISEAGHLLPLDPDVGTEENLRRLQVNALAVHQRSMGRSDELVQILERTVAQVERTHARVKALSTSLFIAGLIVLAAGVSGVLLGEQEAVSAVLSAIGGFAAFAAVFWTTPLDKVSASISDLVKLETAFLGYVRVIGEIDSFFQMQYLDIVGNRADGRAQLKDSLATAIRDTTQQMKDMMSHTVALIDSHVAGNGEALGKLRAEVDDAARRLSRLESGN